MKLYLMFIMFLLSTLLFPTYEAQGARLGRMLTQSTTSNQEIIKISSINESNQDQELVLPKTDELPSTAALKNRRLSSTTATKKKAHLDHWLPKIHEDYYGPKHHRQRHH